jgi:hypothetical protein
MPGILAVFAFSFSLTRQFANRLLQKLRLKQGFPLLFNYEVQMQQGK